MNAGKPSKNPFTNSFVIKVQNDAQRSHLFFVAYSLYESKRIHPNLIGSVIPYIRIREYQQLLFNTWRKAEENPEEWLNQMDRFRTILKLENQLEKQLKLIRQAKIALCNL
jgi:hypothetical protein